MSNATNPPADGPRIPTGPTGSIWRRTWSAAQFVVALAVTLGFLAYLIFTPTSAPPAPSAVEGRPAAEVVEVAGPGFIRVQPGSPLDRKIQVVAVRKERIADPVMTVTGRVVASLRPGKDKETDYWQFDAPEVLTAFTDWRKAQADITFAETQLAAVKDLAEARVTAQQKVVARLENLVSAGSDAPKDLDAEKANLKQAEITGRKDVHEAETAVQVARRNEAALARQLQQAGLAPELLRSATTDIDIVQADVPEGTLGRVETGQSCQATFFGIPNQRFDGKVNGIVPVLSKDRRSLRVLFFINDPRDQLRPGMFAEIGLGTDPRDGTLAPGEGVLHVGRSDYVLVSAGANTWRVVPVQVGEAHTQDNEVEIVSGLAGDERIVGKGAILFKPLVVRSLLPAPAARPEDSR